MLLSEVLAATGAMVASGPELLPRSMSGSVVLLESGSMMMAMACVATGVIGVIGTMQVEVRRLCSVR